MFRIGSALVALAAVLAIAQRAEAAAASSQTSAATAPSSPYNRTVDVIYGRSYGTALTMDVLTPRRAANHAAIILVVSGGWFSSHDSIGSPLMDALLAPFTDRGFTVFAVVHGSQPKFTIPEIRMDINRAVRFIRYHAKDWDIDPNRIGITGGSAGGHLSLLQGCGPLPPSKDAADPVDRESSRLQAVACLFPPTDFLNWGESHINVLDTQNMAPFRAAFDFHEMDPKTHMRERLVDRLRIIEIEKEISPITYASADSPPTLIIHGEADQLVPIQQAQIMIEKLKAANVPAELVSRPGLGHGWPDAREDVKRLADWFEQYLIKNPVKDSNSK